MDDESATAVAGAQLDAHFVARDVHLVMASRGGRPRSVEVLLDGRPLPGALAGADVRRGRATVGGQRLYRLVRLRSAGDHRLTLRFPQGVSGYAFTFG